MRILREAAEVVYRAAELVVARGVDLVVRAQGGRPTPSNGVRQPAPGEEKHSHDCWSMARTNMENTFRFRAGQDRHFVACATFHHEDRGMLMSDLILLQNYFKDKPPREAIVELQQNMNRLLWTFIEKYGDKP